MKPEFILQALQWRYAVQIFDPQKPISQEDLHAILESGRLAPSSFGIEPWKFIVVDTPDVRIKLREVSFGQPKVTDAPHIIVIAYRTDFANLGRERVERTARIYGQDIGQFDGLKQMIDGSVSQKSAQGDLDGWVRSQAYIPLGIMIETASLLGIDSGPMEGFSPDQVDELLGLKAKQLRSTSMLALGHRGEDSAALRPKVRRRFEDVVEFI